MQLTQGLHRSLQQGPDETAVIFSGRRRTTREVAGRVARLAGALRELGVAPGDRVGMLALNSDRYHEYLLAVPWADAVLVPLNVRWSAAEIAYALTDSGTRVLLTDSTFAPVLAELRARDTPLAAVIHCGDGPAPEGTLDYEELVAGHEPVPDARRGYDQLAGIFYTGGTTGSPKGVMISHRNIVWSAMGMVASGHFLTPAGRYLHAAPMFHLADLAAWVGRELTGGTHVIIPSFEPLAVAECVQAHQVTDVLLVPTMVQLVVSHPAIGSYDLSSLRHVTYGAAPITEAVLDRALKLFPGAGFLQGYGMTEMSPVIALLAPADHADGGLRRSAGRAAMHAEVRIAGPDGGELPRGTVGEIVCRGGGLMLGYWNQPDETARAVRDGWLHTGDAGYMDDRGYLFIVDRLKDMIISGGENVYSAEVENVLSRHPAVAACAVIGVPDPQWGERVHAVVVPAGGAAVSADELREFCRGQIGGYKIPRSVEFTGALPVSGAGKVLKRELRRPYWEGTGRAVT
ncbi:MAG: long-chain-fatty-acid--CoA ligase [Gemmatimonadota bacterium]